MIVVLTDPRRGEHLAATLASVDSSATSELRVVLVDGASNSVTVRPGWVVVGAPKPPGRPRTENRWSTWAAFEAAVAAGEDLLFFEDDVVGCPNAVRYAEELPVPRDCAWLSLYAPWGDISFPHGIWRRPAAQFVFCQALKVPLATCRELAGARAEMEAHALGGSDECMAAVGGRRDWLVGYHYPGLFQHVGHASLVSADRTLMGPRSSRAWLCDVDAMRLRRQPGSALPDHFR